VSENPRMYAQRVIRIFRSGEVTCEEPLATINRQSGLVAVHLEGKVRRLAYIMNA
jgi:hypothetical protein